MICVFFLFEMVYFLPTIYKQPKCKDCNFKHFIYTSIVKQKTDLQSFIFSTNESFTDKDKRDILELFNI